MPTCSYAGCEHCNPRFAKERRALKGALDQIKFNAFKDADQVLGWNTNEFWEFHDTPWFKMLLLAYNTGVKEAMAQVENELSMYDDE